MAKSSKKKAKKQPPHEVVELGEFERFFELILHAELTPVDDATAALRNETVLDINFLGDEKTVLLGHCTLVNSAGGEPTKLREVLLQRRVVLDFSTLEAFPGDSRKSNVALYAPPLPEHASASPTPPTAVQLAANARGRGKRRSISPTEAKVSKSRAAASIEIIRGEKVAQTPLTLRDVLSQPTFTYTLEPSTAIPGLACCSVELVTKNTCLGTTAVLERYRPVVVTVHSVDNFLPQVPVYAEIFLAGHTITTSTLLSKGPSPFLFRDMVLLGKSTPLSVYQQFLMHPVVVKLYSEESAAGSSGRLLGTGYFSLHEMVTDRQTYTHELVQLLPTRPSAASDENTLTAACCMEISVDVTIPLPTPIHVLETGGVVEKQFLTRGVVIIPYNAPWSKEVIGCLLRELLNAKRADPQRQVTRYEEPQDDLSEVELAATHAAKTKGKKGVATTRPPAKPKAKGKGCRPPTPPEPPRPTLFEEPFRVVSPEGISGFEVSDGEYRILCLEGPVPEVHRIFAALDTAANGDPAMKLLLNAELFVPQRSYCAYPLLVDVPERKPPPVAKPDANTSGGSSARLRSQTPSEHPSHSAVNNSEDTIPSVPQLEDETGSGCGMRIHRIRLRDTLRSLMAHQRFLIRRTLSEECISCFQKLYAMITCETLREVFSRGLFPTAADIISLERSFGVTLELVDIFGSEEFVCRERVESSSPSVHLDDSVVRKEVTASFDVDVGALTIADVGRLTAFTGTVVQGTLPPVPKHLLTRYGCVIHMVSDKGEAVLVAFAKDRAKGTIRYYISGQVVKCGNELLLYCLDMDTLATSHTDSHNRAFEAHLQERERRLRQCLPRGGSRKALTASVQVQCGATPPCDCSDSQSDEDDATCPPLRTDAVDESLPCVPLYQQSHRRPTATRTSTLRAAAGASLARPAAEDYKKLWSIYHSRAPKGDSYPVSKCGPPHVHLKKPPSDMS